jgi:hypothetical protein
MDSTLNQVDWVYILKPVNLKCISVYFCHTVSQIVCSIQAISYLLYISHHSHEFCYCYEVGAQCDPCTATISDLLFITIWILIISDSSIRSLWNLPTEIYSSEAGEITTNCRYIFFHEVSLSYLKGSLTCRKTERYAIDGFTSPSKEVFGISIVLKNPYPRQGLDPWILGSSGKNANY